MAGPRFCNSRAMLLLVMFLRIHLRAVLTTVEK